jgi:hypothetical protein
MFMNRLTRTAFGFALALSLTAAAGCADNIALIGRPTLQLDQEEIFAEIERVDTSSRLLHLRTEDNRDRVISYSSNARVLYHGRDYSIAQLERGDQVSMQLQQDGRGSSYTNLIRVQESSQDRNPSQAGDTGSSTKIQTLDGRVEQLNIQLRSFAIRDHSSAPVVVSLPSNAERLAVDRFRALRNGDYVRIEGRFLDERRFEMASFLGDTR